MTEYKLTMHLEVPDDIDPCSVFDLAMQYGEVMAQEIETYSEDGKAGVLLEDTVCCSEVKQEMTVGKALKIAFERAEEMKREQEAKQ